MKNLILFAVIAFAAWYGWTHYEQFKGKGQNEVVVTNQSAHAVDRLRIQIAQRTEVVEHLEAGASVMRTFPTPPSARGWRPTCTSVESSSSRSFRG